ncbi:MAG: N-acetylmuramoyl-L-alanine amidase [Bacteroidetes bacterium]|nr:N-acetylmuramoyl-L-alanine amidase [Bacteroidota bacterium]MBS1981051.1 N-acetylmuramoyl-L-alanine amidase [Bacteroidota bacterium]
MSLIDTFIRNIPLKAFLLAITLLNSSATFLVSGTKVATVVIDPGHGGRDPGNMGKKSKEKDIALKISLKFGAYIEKNHPDVKVIYTRKDDRYVDLDERAVLANKVKADLFICIHCNSEGGNSAYGTETFVMGLSKDQRNFEVAKRENSVMLMDENQERYEGFDPGSPESYILFTLNQSAFQESSLRFAQKIEDQLKKKVGRYSRGVKQAGFWVLWRTAMPSVLVETGFLSNAKEESYLITENGQDMIAAGIYRAFKEYKTEIESINPKDNDQ